MATTFQAAVERFIDQVRVDDKPIAFYDTADSVSTGTTLTHVRRFANSTFGANQYVRKWLDRPSATAANNKLKRILSVANDTGVVTHDGTAYSGDGSVLYYRVWNDDWHPYDYVYPLMNRALEECWTWWREVLSLIDNASGEASTVGGSNSGASAARGTTAANVRFGAASVQVTDSGGGGGYHQYATFDAAAGRNFTLGFWVRITTGATAVVTLVDVSNANATIKSQSISGLGQWWYVELSGQFPATCYLAALRVGMTTASGVAQYDSPYIYWDPVTDIDGPSWMTRIRRTDGDEAIRLLRFKSKLAGDGTPVAARAMDLELIPQGDYQVLNSPAAANPVVFELTPECWQNGPVIIEAKRPFSHFNSTGSDAALTALTDSNPVPLRLWVAAAKMLAAEDRGLPQLKLWADQFNEEQRLVQSILRTQAPGQRGLTWNKAR